MEGWRGLAVASRSRTVTLEGERSQAGAVGIRDSPALPHQAPLGAPAVRWPSEKGMIRKCPDWHVFASLARDAPGQGITWR